MLEGGIYVLLQSSVHLCQRETSHRFTNRPYSMNVSAQPKK
jgi:hypothetical protein